MVLIIIKVVVKVYDNIHPKILAVTDLGSRLTFIKHANK